MAERIVTTAADIVDATDGVLSLREAVTETNGLGGEDTIRFAPELAGELVLLGGSDLPVTDSLIIDGSTPDGPVIIDGDASSRILRIEGGGQGPGAVDVTLRDIILQNGVAFPDPAGAGDFVGGAVISSGASLTLEDATIRYNAAYFSGGIDFVGGSLTLTDSNIVGNYASYYSGGLYALDARVTITRSTIADNVAGSYSGGLDLLSSEVTISDSTIAGNEAYSAAGLYVAAADASLVITGTTISGNYAAYGSVGGLAVFGDVPVEIVNSTIHGNYALSYGGGLGSNGGDIALTHTTVTANGAGYGQAGGIYAQYGTNLEITGSIVAGNGDVAGNPTNIEGAITSGGGNIFGDAAVDGAIPDDVQGVDTAEVFAGLEPIALDLPPFGPVLEGGALEDNGGPTFTVALKAGPAVGNADPVLAPPLDQRGVPRDAAPDSGAFELDGEPVAPDGRLPPLAENRPVEPELINGLDGNLLLIGGEPATLTFIDEVATFQNSLGLYEVLPDGTIGETELLFERVNSTVFDPRFAQARDGEGPLEPGETLVLSDILGPDSAFNLFLIADGFSLNDGFAGELSFTGAGGGPASVFDDEPPLLVIERPDGTREPAEGNVLHAGDFVVGPGNPLNPQGSLQTISAVDRDGRIALAFEDKLPFQDGSDMDFNDAQFRIDGLVVALPEELPA